MIDSKKTVENFQVFRVMCTDRMKFRILLGNGVFEKSK